MIGYVNLGHKVEYVFFWGHRKTGSGISKSCLSQWYETKFLVDGHEFSTAEHYMMAKKAELFGDIESYEKIRASANPGEVKKIGRNVAGFDEGIWIQNRFEIVVDANRAKFGQNPELTHFLLGTGGGVLVEASPVDRIWGIGLAADDPAAQDPNRWRGLNLLGFALMCVRDELIADG